MQIKIIWHYVERISLQLTYLRSSATATGTEFSVSGFVVLVTLSRSTKTNDEKVKSIFSVKIPSFTK